LSSGPSALAIPRSAAGRFWQGSDSRSATTSCRSLATCPSSS
jgi:hypothetical protein